ncbi:formate transporter [Enterococcus sp. AZ194]|uniref:formate/nitrite transporter family protein n=1 Tax=Enterococcus sp. AZ194 TaxID=2774629 RepID=UPI003F27B036
MHTPYEIREITIQTARAKVAKRLKEKIILAFIGGAMISLGYLAYVRVISSIVEEWGSFASFIGACVFPVGLIVILLGGGELITGNMMVVSFGFFAKRVTGGELLSNWLIVTVANLVGALFVAYFFGHIVGLTSSGVYLEEVVKIAGAKIEANFIQSFVSGIGCNWFVCLAVWLCYGAKEAAGKIMGIWFPVMLFVAIGFQHSVANMFIIPAAIFEGSYSWGEFIQNIIPVYLGNIVGGAVFVSFFYNQAFNKNKK